MADLDYDSALTLSATSMRRAMESEDPTFAIVSAIDSLRIALLAASRDLADTLDDRAALTNGTRVVVLDDEDDHEPFEGHCGGYFCAVHNLHISCSHPDYDLLVDEHEAMHATEFVEAIEAAEEQDATAADQVVAATEIREYLSKISGYVVQDCGTSLSWVDVDHLIHMVMGGIRAGAAPAMLAAWQESDAGSDQ